MGLNDDDGIALGILEGNEVGGKVSNSSTFSELSMPVTPAVDTRSFNSSLKSAAKTPPSGAFGGHPHVSPSGISARYREGLFPKRISSWLISKSAVALLCGVTWSNNAVSNGHPLQVPVISNTRMNKFGPRDVGDPVGREVIESWENSVDSEVGLLLEVEGFQDIDGSEVGMPDIEGTAVEGTAEPSWIRLN